MLEIRLLGEQRVAGAGSVPGRPLSSRSVALLAYLVLHAGLAQARPHLAGIFWPDSAEPQARTNLRRELHNLRLLIDGDPSLVVEPAALTWRDTPSCRVDIRVFELERAAARSAEATEGGAERLGHAAAAIAVYRGELMPGAYDDWVLEHRDRLRQECVELCDLAARGWRSSGNRTRAMEVARRRIQLAPLEEVGYRILMRLQAESGNPAAAMSTYHRCATALEHELGVSPDPQTTKLAEQLLGHRDSPRSPPDSAGGGSRRVVTGRAELVGRDAEVGRLLQRWQQATLGRSGLVLVSGEAGVGKSRLIAELTGVAAAEGAIVASTRCFGLAGRLALAPVAEWLRSRDLRPVVAALEPVWREEVARLIPGGRADADPSRPGPPGGGRALVDAWQRHRFFEGLARAVLSADRPTLLVLDDLQWCDEETMDWLAFLLAFSAEARLLVAATVRADELPENRAVSASLRTLRSAGVVSELALTPLDPDGTGALAASLFGRPLGASQTALLHAATGGYPLFLVEAARSGQDPTVAASPQALTNLHTVLKRRLEQPSPAAREVAGLAAAVGRDFSLDLLSEASDLDAETLVQAVDELWRRRILLQQGDGYDFAHALLRDAAYDSVSPAQRWLLHRRLAQGLELLHAGHVDDIAAQLADQYDRAGRTDRALRYVRRAAEAAEAVFANAEALRHHRRSLELVARLPPGADRDSHELAVLLAMSAPLNALHGYSSVELQSALERSTALAERLGRPRTVFDSLVGLFAVRFVQGHTSLAHEIGVRALALAEAHPDLAGQAHFAFAGSALGLGHPAVAVTHFDLAVDLSGGEVTLLVGTRMEVHARAWEAHAHWLLGDDDRAVLRSADAVAQARAIDHPYNLAVALAYAAVVHQIRGEAAALGTVVAELRALCARYDFAYYGEWATILGGWATAGESGVTQIQRGIDRLRAQGSYARMPYWLSLLAETMLGCGRRDSARAVLDAALVAAEQRDDRWWLPEVLRLRGGLERGRPGVDLLCRAALLAERQSSPALASRCRADLAARGVPTVRAQPSVPDGGPDSAHAANAERTAPSLTSSPARLTERRNGDEGNHDDSNADQARPTAPL